MTSGAFPHGDFASVPEARYSRLCPSHSNSWRPFDPAELTHLARAMQDSPEKRAARAGQNRRRLTMPSGYVYFGQFVDHDITRDTRTLDKAGPDVEETFNYRTPALDLDSLYGKDPAAVPWIYEEDGLRLRLGPTAEAETRFGKTDATLDDLPRENGIPIVVDRRSEESLIIAQLHVLFAKFHNRALELLRDEPDIFPLLPAESLFEQTRRFVTWHYQWLVINDFLPFVCRRAVLDDIKKGVLRLFSRRYTPSDSPVALPVEFTVAAFRFGHSAVQHRYELNRYVGSVYTSEIIRMTKRGSGIDDRLPANYVIDWDHFFTGNEVQLNRAHDLGPFISEALYVLPHPTTHAFGSKPTVMSQLRTEHRMTPPLPEMTLQRGSKMRLPSGQEFASRFGYDPIPAAKIPAPAEEGALPESMRDRTPLWYYLLCEAAVEPNPEPPSRPIGLPLQKLGTIGSRIIAETFYQLLFADAHSFFYAERPWQPPIFKSGPAKRSWQLRSMPELVRFVAAAA